jgi:hypothetical protein
MSSVPKTGKGSIWVHVIGNGQVSVTSNLGVLAPLNCDALSPRSAQARIALPGACSV